MLDHLAALLAPLLRSLDANVPGGLVKSLSTTTDKDTENSMLIRIVMRQILMAQTQTVTVPDSSNMSNPASTASPEDAGVTSPVPAPNINVTALP
ncbi:MULTISPECIES: hypothetical protein [unclassified Caballeronia]|uniref:hypothetical protein n=1 Tax=unclassified Caballeronia TaxID=2646786 RepID=UPI002028E1C7|nr:MULTISPECIES: hypothetical protein [unclassified Caballeronia]